MRGREPSVSKLVEECQSNGLLQGTSQLRLVAERLWLSLFAESMTCWASEGPVGNEALSQPWRQRGGSYMVVVDQGTGL